MMSFAHIYDALLFMVRCEDGKQQELGKEQEQQDN